MAAEQFKHELFENILGEIMANMKKVNKISKK